MVQRVAMFAVLPLIGVSIAIQPLLGFNYGAHLFERVKKTLWYGIFGATGIGLALWALVHLFPEQIVGFFGITNESLRDFTVFALRCNCSCCPSSASRSWARITPGNRAAAQSIFLSLTRQILFLVPLLIVLPMVLPSWFHSSSASTRCTSPPRGRLLAIFTTVVFIVLEMGREEARERRTESEVLSRSYRASRLSPLLKPRGSQNCGVCL
ncbi:MAG: MATE family efflux transporter [Eggerthella lenta]